MPVIPGLNGECDFNSYNEIINYLKDIKYYAMEKIKYQIPADHVVWVIHFTSISTAYIYFNSGYREAYMEVSHIDIPSDPTLQALVVAESSIAHYLDYGFSHRLDRKARNTAIPICAIVGRNMGFESELSLVVIGLKNNRPCVQWWTHLDRTWDLLSSVDFKA